MTPSPPSIQWRQHLPPLVRAAAKSVDAGPTVGLAWSIARTPQVLAALRKIPCAIPGGDILELRAQRFLPTRRSWHCGSLGGEGWAEYVSRSHAEAADYLSRLSQQESLWFVPLCTLEPSVAQWMHPHER